MSRYGEETQVEIDPYEIVGEFVHKYETLIKPGIQSVNIAGAVGVIGDVLERAKPEQKSVLQLGPEVYHLYITALTYLDEIREASLRLGKEVTQKNLEGLLLSASRQVGELDFIMISRKSEVYEQHRQRQGERR